jgi:hypothetical protein
MIKRSHRLRLLLEAPQPLLIAGKRDRQDFDGHITVQPRVPRSIHLTHAASAGGSQDLIPPEFGA